jgi:pectate lyase
MVANYYKPGPATEREVRDRIVEPSAREAGDEGSWYVVDNLVVGDPEVTADNWRGVDGDDYVKLDAPWPAMSIEQQTAEEAYLSVLEHVGATLPARDAVDARIIEEVRNGTATYGDGIISSQSDVGGWPELWSSPAPSDADHDGMPDQWERTNGLNPNDPSDRNKLADDGYTMLENYLNGLVDSN